MIKIAIFVEGHTELEFIQKVIHHVCANRGYTIEIKEQKSKVLHDVSIQTNQSSEISHYILLINCCTETQVKSQIISQYQSLQNNGYSRIIGLRDIYPLKHADVPKISSMLTTGIQIQNTPVDIILAILEIETWFIGELSHFTRLTPPVSLDIVNNCITQLGINLSSDFVDGIEHPAQTLDAIYQNSGLRYKKKMNQINRTVNALCMNSLFGNTRTLSPSLDRLLSCIESAI